MIKLHIITVNMVKYTKEQKEIIRRIKDKELKLIPVSGSSSACWKHFYKIQDPSTEDYFPYIYAPDCGTLYVRKSSLTHKQNKI